MKYVKDGGVLAWSGGTAVLRSGDSIEDSHPLVIERPDLFTDEPSTDIKPAKRVQSAMQRPGETRVERGTTPVVKAPPRG